MLLLFHGVLLMQGSKNVTSSRSSWQADSGVPALVWWPPRPACCSLCLSDFHPGPCVLAVANSPDLSVFLRFCLFCCLCSVCLLIDRSIHPPTHLLNQQTSHHPTVFTSLDTRTVPDAEDPTVNEVGGQGLAYYGECEHLSRQWQVRERTLW